MFVLRSQGLDQRLCQFLPVALATLLCAGILQAQVDPGVRGGTAGAGGPFAGLSAAETAFFNSSKVTFGEVDSVSGGVPGTGSGLGPTFNMDSCAGCHAQPDVGGTSPFTNPQVAVATKNGARNTVPSFISLAGPVREVRFKVDANNNPDGGVKDLYTITGRSDAAGCNLSQPDFNTALAQGNAIFRIPTPVFGTGLIEAIPGHSININLAADPDGRKGAFGIHGISNTNGNDGTVTKFGWKAQNKSLLIFSGEAYNVEQGVTNEVFNNERLLSQTNNNFLACEFNGVPEDHTNFNTGENSDAVQFAAFMRLSAPPTPVSPLNTSQSNGRTIFSNIGCNLCHTPTLQTEKASVTGMSFQNVNLYSDLGVHHMGSGLSDGISQGKAGPDQFRTAPLWGVGQRIFFLHDGRTDNLITAIRAHRSSGSEANSVINNYDNLATSSKQSLLDFLRSL
jgi:CxxC motif-containing protein (DUF1111 family)